MEMDGLATSHNAAFLDDPHFKAAYTRGCRAGGRDYGWPWRVHVGLWTAQAALRIKGDFVECGTNRGFMASAIMEYLNWSSQHRKFFLLDTFAGVDESVLLPEEVAYGAQIRARNELESGFYTTNVDLVRQNFAEWQRVIVIQGAVPKALDLVETDRIAFLHLDMNCAVPEREALLACWPYLSSGALVLADDYGYSGYEQQGIELRRVAKDFGAEWLSLPTGQGLLIRP